MNSGSVQVEFINRKEELEFLKGLLPPACLHRTLVILRSPAGFGKSSLTSRVANLLGNRDHVFVVVDPMIRAKNDNGSVYDGLFIQKSAQALSELSADHALGMTSLADYLRTKRWKTVGQKNPLTALRSMPSTASAYGLAIEYLERFLAMGRYGASEILTSNSREAVGICSAYVADMARTHGLVFVIREVHYMDLESLRFFLQLNLQTENNHLLLEYTTDDGKFDPIHQKLFQRELESHPSAHILDLMRLDRDHFEYLLRRFNAKDKEFDSGFYGRWNGDVRRLEELRYTVRIGRQLSNPSDFENTLSDVAAQLRAHFAELTSSQRLLLVLCVVHAEPVNEQLLVAAAAGAVPNLLRQSLKADIAALRDVHGFLLLRDGFASIQNENIVQAVRQLPDYASLVALTERLLRDLYLRMVRDREFVLALASQAIRQAFYLSVRMRDVAALLDLIDQIGDNIRQSNDQTVFVDLIVDVLDGPIELFSSERTQLIGWASDLAYDIADFTRTIKLLERLPNRSSAQNVILASCYTENGRHDLAAAIVVVLRASATNIERTLAADLTDAGIALDSGNWLKCKDLLDSIIEQGSAVQSPLVGHALRLLESIQDEPDSAETLLKSVSWFEALSLNQARAYSAIAAAVPLARMGRSKEADRLMESAARSLIGQIRDQHIVWNNRAAMGLLVPQPNFAHCCEYLRTAAQTSRDDFCDLVIMNNLAIAVWKESGAPSALEFVARALAILRQPTFAERDVFWPVCYNLAEILKAGGEQGRADEVRRMPYAVGWKYRSDDLYWAYRYGETAERDPRMARMFAFDYHPAYISHWQMEREILARLS